MSRSIDSCVTGFAADGLGEMDGVPEPVEVDAVDVVVAGDLFDELDGAPADVLAVEVRRPPTSEPATPAGWRPSPRACPGGRRGGRFSTVARAGA